MRQYPIWVDMVNNSYNSSKSYGVNDYNIQNVMIGTSSRNSFDFCKIEMSVADIDGKKVYNLRVDYELIKEAHYNLKTKKMEVEDVKTSNFVQSENDPSSTEENILKIKYFKKWKDEDEAKENLTRKKATAARDIYNNNFRSKQENDKLYNNFLNKLEINV